MAFFFFAGFAACSRFCHVNQSTVSKEQSAEGEFERQEDAFRDLGLGRRLVTVSGGARIVTTCTFRSPVRGRAGR